ncbi:MAG: N-formylglutamate amidohydrolase [Calditrichaeota bacterium]|nr:N-formylglutamate amidohydrolase [Calditrichota bacterium]
MKNTTLLFTSEHGGNDIPAGYSELFNDFHDVLATHRGYDLGIWSVADALAQAFDARLFKNHVTRLLVDTNRSLWRRTLFSEKTKPLPKKEKQKILDTYYYPHRNAITEFIETEIGRGQKILHIATHSFTPVMKGEVRNADIGLLYDPERSNEKNISKEWKNTLAATLPDFRVRFNYPYRGKPDGLTAHFRKLHANGSYLGVELEVNQKYVTNGSFPSYVQTGLVQSFRKTMESFSWL